MNWIETLFGVNPDGDSGVTEAAFLIAILVLLWVVHRARSGKRHAKHRAQGR